jgi:hypothetical protein
MALVLGVLLGGGAVAFYDYMFWKNLQYHEATADDWLSGGGNPDRPKPKGKVFQKKKGFGGKGFGMGNNMGAPFGPGPREQLVTLVAKLDFLTRKPGLLTLTKEQRDKVAEQLVGLEDLKELTDEGAAKRVNKILTALDDHKEVLEMVGVQFPGSAGPPPAALPLNPFRNKGRDRLDDLRKNLDMAGTVQ